MSGSVFCLRRSKTEGGIFVRSNGEGVSVLDIFPKTKFAFRFCKHNGLDTEAVGYQKIAMDKFTTFLPNMSINLGVDLIQFGEHQFPLTKKGIGYLTYRDEDLGETWELILSQLGEPGLWFAVGIWWDNAAKGNILKIDGDFVDTYLPEEVVKYIVGLQERLMALQQQIPQPSGEENAPV